MSSATQRLASNLGGGKARLGLLCVIAVGVMLAGLSPSSSWARTSGPRVSASFVAVGSEVDAGGTVGAGDGAGRGSRRRWKAVLQQRVGSRWVTRDSRGLRAHRRVSSFSLRWAEATPGGRVVVRVEITSGRLVVAQSASRSVTSSSPVSVQSTLRTSTVQPSAGAVLSVSGSPGGKSVVVLARGARMPEVGGALVLNLSAKAPSGLLGVVTAVSRSSDGSTRVTTRPGTLQDAYSAFDAHLNGELGQLVERNATTASARGHAAVNLGVFNTSFGCDDPTVQRTITHSIDLSTMHVSANVAIPSYSDGYYGPGVEFALFGQPKLNFGVTFTGSQKCEAKATVKIPIPDTPGLFVEIGPDFTLSGNGSVGVSFTWAPRVFYGFARFRSGPNWDSHEFHNGGNVNFTGAAALKLSLALDAGISLDGRVGVRGSLGPEVTGQVSAQTSPPQTCLSVDADFAASLTASAKVFFKEYTFNIGSATFGNVQLYHACTNTPGAGGGGRAGGGGGPGGGGGGPTPPGGGGSRATEVSLNDDDNACALLTAGVVDCWGINSFGQLGNGSTAGSSTPVAVAGITNTTAIAVGGGNACAVLAGGSIECWGANFDGELGNGTTTASSTPVLVSGITNATAIAAGESNTCAVLVTGGVDCWGDNEGGQLGNGTSKGPDTCVNGPCSTTPVQVSGITNATAVTVGSGFACALLAGGGVDCWGDEVYGVLGQGSTPPPDICKNDRCSTTPLPVTGISDASAIAAGVYHMCAALTGGSIDCWGWNSSGQLGNGTTSEGNSTPTPAAVSGITSAVAISAGQQHTCAVLAGGSVDCWGENVSGGLGNGSTTDSSVPVPVQTISDASSTAAGNGDSCALLATGGIDCWGLNDNGQLGDGTTAGPDTCGFYPCSTTPVQVIGIP
jgi:alpha-tubulin suppressor-like RCC1 family protein